MYQRNENKKFKKMRFEIERYVVNGCSSSDGCQNLVAISFLMVS